LRSGLVDGVLVYALQPAPAWYIVRGYAHPPGLIVAQPYRAPDCGSPPPIPRQPLECLATSYWALERRAITVRLWPSDAWRTRGSRVLDELLDAIGAWWRGLTGSRALACDRPGSDYDVIAAVSNPIEAYTALTELRESGALSQCKWGHIRGKRAPGHPRDAATNTEIVGASLTDSCYKGVPYTLRILRRIVEGDCGPPRAPLGKVRVYVYLEGGPESILVPARYRASSSLGSLTVETWRTRYQGLPSGRYLVEGDLYVEQGKLVLTPDHGGFIAIPE